MPGASALESQRHDNNTVPSTFPTSHASNVTTAFTLASRVAFCSRRQGSDASVHEFAPKRGNHRWKEKREVPRRKHRNAIYVLELVIPKPTSKVMVSVPSYVERDGVGAKSIAAPRQLAAQRFITVSLQAVVLSVVDVLRRVDPEGGLHHKKAPARPPLPR
jgi:hypothetical protein